ncbi:SDR family NAD(P)-dependent oxidoreductase [Bradyrhizobium sp. BWA-3-5]|uniref:SDR family NAD(P)-dependent oxidoreductase n=1 Tax=Bradyrhizobium sp. BWA-3-5 TaxID=3080013 RepID=UPI00293E4F26|nr:SDR family NAD(P)-dependent oxidoreductase [Bradyrhizobium sp. BWA-3-5]WOH63941.1 SDR family NAD(P)-dependent oxidoreductase [Bradyrhizobium sp. BWA-3-5]
MNLNLGGRTALVTASTDGSGLAAAINLASYGARVAICGRDEAKLVNTKKEIDDAAGKQTTVAIAADLAKAACCLQKPSSILATSTPVIIQATRPMERSMISTTRPGTRSLNLFSERCSAYSISRASYA